VNATFKETGLLVEGADVRISGVNVGRVITVKAKGLNSIVTLDIKRQYAPIPTDTRAILRQKTLLGEAYIMLSTGTASGPRLPDGGVIPVSQVEDTQQLDQVLNSFDPPTQRNLQALLQGSFTALAGRGQDINDAIGNLDPAVSELTAVVGVLNKQQGNVRRLVNSTATVLTTLGSRSADLQRLVTSGNSVFQATADRNVALTATVNALPGFLTQLRSTLGTLGTTLAIADPSLKALRPVAGLVPPALSDVIQLSGPAVKLLHQAPSLVNAANKALPSIQRFTAAFKPAVDTLLPAIQQVTPLINYMALYSKELTAAMANVGGALQAVAPANTSVATAGTPAGMAHYGRVMPILNVESLWGQSIREPSNRHSIYYAPGAQNNLATGLESSDCNNLGNPSQIPLLGSSASSNVKCTVQAAVNWGNGIAAGYYPRLTQTPAK
jgi:virulence factor Mce-like protein